MSACQFPRKLAAILYADVAGYSRLTEQDEEGTHMRVLSYKRVLARQIMAYGGHVVHSEGDSLLAELPSAELALTCALTVQESLLQRNLELSKDHQVHFRIGINLSEVFVDTTRQRIFGYGVNVAARLESMASPGGVCISRSIRDALPESLPVEFQDLGAQSMKNISNPVQAFHARLISSAQPLHRQMHSFSSANLQVAHLSAPPDAANADSEKPVEGTYVTNLQYTTGEMTDQLFATPAPLQNFFSRLFNKPLINNYEVIVENPTWREKIAQTIESRPGKTGIDLHSRFLHRWLRWNRKRFGPYRRSVFKLFDFCFLHAFLYSSLFFFIGLIFLQGQASIGNLRISFVEVGPSAAINQQAGSAQYAPSMQGEAGTLPILVILLVVYWLADQSLRRARDVPSRIVHSFDLRRCAIWLVLSIVLAMSLALNGFGAGLIALTVAMSAYFLRNMRGSGVFYMLTTGSTIMILHLIVVGAESGNSTMKAIAASLHDLAKPDVERFLLMWFLLPFINAIFDTLSWYLSRRLGLVLKYGQRRSTFFKQSATESHRYPANRSSLLKYWLITLLWGLLDLVLALLLLAALATAVGAAFEFFDYLRHKNSGYYTLDNTIAGINSDPLGEGFWLTAMLITTLFPTFLHLLAVGLGLLDTLSKPVEHGGRLSAILMYGPAHPLFDHASHHAAWLQFVRATRTIVLTCTWIGLLAWLVAGMLSSGTVVQILTDSLIVGQHFAAIVIDIHSQR